MHPVPNDEQKELFPPDEKKRIEELNKQAKEKLAELQRNARKKVPPKPPVVDDDGDPIPF